MARQKLLWRTFALNQTRGASTRFGLLIPPPCRREIQGADITSITGVVANTAKISGRLGARPIGFGP